MSHKEAAINWAKIAVACVAAYLGLQWLGARSEPEPVEGVPVQEYPRPDEYMGELMPEDGAHPQYNPDDYDRDMLEGQEIP